MTDDGGDEEGGRAEGAEVEELTPDQRRQRDAAELNRALNDLCSQVQAGLNQVGLTRHVVVIAAHDPQRKIVSAAGKSSPEGSGPSETVVDLMGQQAIYAVVRLPEEGGLPFVPPGAPLTSTPN